jgi:2-oxopent-4-enoate/cis-2-oxohex-4-enoate hydratase
VIDQEYKEIALKLYDALKDQYCLEPLTNTYQDISITDAYKISRNFLQRRMDDGDRLVGKKIGVTSKVVQEMLGVHQPDFGFLTSSMQYSNNAKIKIEDLLIQPRAEGEIAFILSNDLSGPGISDQDVKDSTESIVPCFEIVDSRIKDWNIKIEDTIADNASCGVFVLGNERIDVTNLNLADLELKMYKNNKLISSGKGSAVQGNPYKAVAWLANTLGELGIPFLSGEIILSGSLVPLEPVEAGDKMRLTLGDLGSAELEFI